MDNDCSSLEKYLDKFLPHLNDYDFVGAIVSNSYRVLYRHEGIIGKTVSFFNKKDYAFKVFNNRGLIIFESGAKIHFTRTDRVNGLLLDTALIIDSLATTREDILKVKSRLWNHKGVGGELWFLNINDV